MNDENTEEVRVLEAQIERLKAEVAALQDQQQDNQKDLTLHLTGQIHNAMWVSPPFSLQPVFFPNLHILGWTVMTVN